MNQKGFISIAVVTISVVILIVLGGVAYYALNNFDDINQEISVSNALATDIGLDVSDLDVNIQNMTEDHARVEITDPSGNSKIALVVKVDGTWRVAEYGNESYSCERANKFGFPGDLISDCILQFPDAKTVTEAKNIINGVISENLSTDTFGVPNRITVVGTISYISSPSNGQITVIGEDGETIDIPIGSNTNTDQFEGIEEGDTVAVSVILDPSKNISTSTGTSDSGEGSTSTENSTSESGSTNTTSGATDTSPDSSNIIVVDSLEEISGEILNSETVSGDDGSGGGTSSTESSGSGNTSSGTTNESISEPSSSNGSTSNPDANIYDIDNSNLDVKLIND